MYEGLHVIIWTFSYLNNDGIMSDYQVGSGTDRRRTTSARARAFTWCVVPILRELAQNGPDISHTRPRPTRIVYHPHEPCRRRASHCSKPRSTPDWVRTLCAFGLCLCLACRRRRARGCAPGRGRGCGAGGDPCAPLSSAGRFRRGWFALRGAGWLGAQGPHQPGI